MRIKNGYVLQKIADEYIVVPIGEEADRLHGVIRLNDVGAFLWDIHENGVESIDELEKAIIREYGVEQTVAHNDVKVYIKKLKSIDCLKL